LAEIKVLGICGSPRKGATEHALQYALRIMEEKGAITNQVNLRKLKVHSCIHCDRCIKENTGRCMVFADDGDELVAQWESATTYLIASPVYSMGITPEIVNFISRLRPMRNRQIQQKEIQLPKVGSCITVGGTRHGGQETSAEIINNLYISRGILVCGGGGAYNAGTVWSKDQLEKNLLDDEEGMKTIRTIALRLMSAAKLLQDGFESNNKELLE